MHTQPGQFTDLSVVERGGVGADPDAHPGATERVHDGDVTVRSL